RLANELIGHLGNRHRIEGAVDRGHLLVRAEDMTGSPDVSLLSFELRERLIAHPRQGPLQEIIGANGDELARVLNRRLETHTLQREDGTWALSRRARFCHPLLASRKKTSHVSGQVRHSLRQVDYDIV